MAISLITRGINFIPGLKPTANSWNSEFDAPYNQGNAMARLLNGTTTIPTTIVLTGTYNVPLQLGTIRIWDNDGTLYAKDGSAPSTSVDGSNIDFTAASLVLNQAGNDQDLRVETDTNANALNVDAGLFSGVGAIGLGTLASNTAAVWVDPPAFSSVANVNIARMRVGNTAVVTVPAGTTGIAAAISVEEPNLTATGTVTLAATLYIAGAPTEGSANNALHVASGVSAFGGNLTPVASDGAALGTTALMFSDLMLASGAVINFNAGDVTITHSSNLIAFAGATGGYTFDVPITVASGGTGVATLAANGVLYGNGTGVVLVTAQGEANTILTANAGAPSFSASPTIGTSVTTPTIIITGTYVNPIRIGTMRMWYDSANTVLRVKHGSDPASATDGTIIMEG